MTLFSLTLPTVGVKSPNYAWPLFYQSAIACSINFIMFMNYHISKNLKTVAWKAKVTANDKALIKYEK